MNGIPFSQRLQNNQDNCNTVRNSMPNFHSGSAQNVLQVLLGSPPCCEVSERAHFLPASSPASSSEAKLGNCRRTVAPGDWHHLPSLFPSFPLPPHTLTPRACLGLPPRATVRFMRARACERRACAQCEMVVPLNERASDAACRPPIPPSILPPSLSQW